MYIMLLNQLAAFVIALHYVKRYYELLKKISFERFEEYEKKYNISLSTQFDDRDQYELFDFITFAAMLIMFSFALIYILPNLLKPSFFNKLVNTGIHIPIVMAVIGIVLHRYNSEVSNEAKKKAMLLISLAINVSFVFSNWLLSLVAFAVIIGKFIWFDSALDFQEAFKTLKMYIKGDELDDLLIKTYSIFYIVHYGFFFSTNLVISRSAPDIGSERVWLLLGSYCLMYLWNEFIVFRKNRK